MFALEKQYNELKKMTVYMDKADKEHTESMANFAANFQSFNTILESGFNLLRAMAPQNYQPYNMQPQYPQQPNIEPNIWSFDCQ